MLIDCKPIVDRIYDETLEIISTVGRSPTLAAVFNANDPAAVSYLNSIKRQAEKANIEVSAIPMPTDKRLLAGLAKDLNLGLEHDGIMYISLPQDMKWLMSDIVPEKNVEGTDCHDDMTLVSCTARACVEIIKSVTSIKGKAATIIGYGKVVGKPLSYLLMREHASSVTTTHKYTINLSNHTLRADILVSAIGIPGIIGPKIVKPGAIVIDAGIAYSNGKILGDVSPEARNIAKVTPVPGGVGPVTTVLMLKNTALAAQGQL